MPRGVSRYDEARLQGRLWTPALLTCDLWYDAADLSTITVATGVSEWRDKSGNANHATQATSGDQPLFEGVSTSGLPALRFAGTQRLNIATPKQYDTTAPACSLFGALRFSSSRVIVFGGGTSDASFFGDGNSTAPLWRNSGDGGVTASTAAANLAAWHLYSGVRTGTESNGATMRLNGDAMTNGTATMSGTFSANRIGYRGTFNQASNGWIGEAIAIPRALSTRERQLVEGYLAHKWNIALRGDHPFRLRAPTLGD